MNIVSRANLTEKGEVSTPVDSLFDILENGKVLIQLSSYVYASRILSLKQHGYQFTIITTNPALRRLFESNEVEVIYIDVQEPRLRELINPLIIRNFRQQNKVFAMNLRLERFTSVILTVNCIDIPILEIITLNQPESCQFYFLPESPSNDVVVCDIFSASRDELLQILKRKVLYRIQSYLGKGAGGRHAYVEIEQRIAGIRQATLPILTDGEIGEDRNSRCIFLASYSYREDEDYFGGAEFLNALKVLSSLVPVHYKIHPGAPTLRSSEFDSLGMEPILNEYPIETLIQKGDLVIGNDSTALPRICREGVTVVSISHMSDITQPPQSYGIDRRCFLQEMQKECGEAILTPRNLEELDAIARSWKANTTSVISTLRSCS